MPNLMDLGVLFGALDTSLSLHYLTNTTDPAVHELCASATSLSKRRIGKDAVEKILAVDGSVWTVTYSAPRDAYCIGPPAGLTAKTLSGCLEQRKVAFKTKLRADKVEKNGVDPVDLRTLVAAGVSRDRKPHDSPSRDAARDRVTKARASLTKTTRSFALKSDKNTSGLSLLERIKLKEKAKKNVQSPEVAYTAYIHGKLAAVYEILYELGRNQKEKTLPFPKVVSMIKDSTLGSISENEATDILASISDTLPSKVTILYAGEIKALKVQTLDRDQDLAHLEKSGPKASI